MYDEYEGFEVKPKWWGRLHWVSWRWVYGDSFEFCFTNPLLYQTKKNSLGVYLDLLNGGINELSWWKIDFFSTLMINNVYFIIEQWKVFGLFATHRLDQLVKKTCSCEIHLSSCECMFSINERR